eukprot:g6257.t1
MIPTRGRNLLSSALSNDSSPDIRKSALTVFHLPGKLGSLQLYKKSDKIDIVPDNLLTCANARDCIFIWLMKQSTSSSPSSMSSPSLPPSSLSDSPPSSPTALSISKTRESSREQQGREGIELLRLVDITWETSLQKDSPSALSLLSDLCEEGKDAFRIIDKHTNQVMDETSLHFSLRIMKKVSTVTPRFKMVRISEQQSHLRCNITGWHVQEDMNEKKFVCYDMICSIGTLTWRVRHRYSEFFKLRSELEDFMSSSGGRALLSSFPQAQRLLPRLPPKKWGKNLGEKFIKSRLRGLRKFMKLLIESKWALSTPCVMSFVGMLSTEREEQFQKSSRQMIHISKLTQLASPGDVLLFRTRSALNWLQRSATGSEWDHVGIVTQRTGSTRLWLLEASGDGVTCFPLVARVRAYAQEFAERIAIRHFQTRPSAVAVQRLVHFTEAVNGKPYSLTPAKLLRRAPDREVYLQDDDEIEDDEEERQSKILENFFCSELVAAGLKTLGFMENVRSSAYYWPGDFGDDGNIESFLKNSIELAPAVAINCRFVEVGFATRR